MPRLEPGQHYRGRREDVAVLNLSVDVEAARLLREYSGAGKKIGRFVEKLIFEYSARVEERQRLQEQMRNVFGE